MGSSGSPRRGRQDAPLHRLPRRVRHRLPRSTATTAAVPSASGSAFTELRLCVLRVDAYFTGLAASRCCGPCRPASRRVALAAAPPTPSPNSGSWGQRGPILPKVGPGIAPLARRGGRAADTAARGRPIAGLASVAGQSAQLPDSSGTACSRRLWHRSGLAHAACGPAAADGLGGRRKHRLAVLLGEGRRPGRPTGRRRRHWRLGEPLGPPCLAPVSPSSPPASARAL